MSQFVNETQALKIAEEFMSQQLGYIPKLIGINKSGSKKHKELMQWVILFETAISGNVVDGPTVVEVSAKTGEINHENT